MGGFKLLRKRPFLKGFFVTFKLSDCNFEPSQSFNFDNSNLNQSYCSELCCLSLPLYLPVLSSAVHQRF